MPKNTKRPARGTQPDYYRILGVDGNASPEEIAEAYHALVLQCHPDLNPGDPQAEARFLAVQAAFEVLSNRVRRTAYNRTQGPYRTYVPSKIDPLAWQVQLHPLKAKDRWFQGNLDYLLPLTGRAAALIVAIGFVVAVTIYVWRQANWQIENRETRLQEARAAGSADDQTLRDMQESLAVEESMAGLWCMGTGALIFILFVLLCRNAIREKRRGETDSLFQFSISSMLALVLGLSLICSAITIPVPWQSSGDPAMRKPVPEYNKAWVAKRQVEMLQAKRQPEAELAVEEKRQAEAVEAIKKLGGRLHGVMLDLAGTQVTDAELIEILKGLNQLQYLNLGNTQITDAGLEHLKGLTQLKWLDLEQTNVTDAGLENLKGLEQLQWLGLEGTKVTDAGVKKLQQALPKCQIFH